MSAGPVKVFERRFPNQLHDLNSVTGEALRFLEENAIGGHALYVANLAIEEMGTNLVKYAYDDTAKHEILLRLEIHPKSLLVILEDDGHEFNPLTWPDPDLSLHPEQRLPGRLVIHLVRELAQEMSYFRSAGRNRVTVKIPL